MKWAGMRRTLRPGGLLIIQGYTPKQLEYGTGGPKQIENLYTRTLLEGAFSDFRDLLKPLKTEVFGTADNRGFLREIFPWEDETICVVMFRHDDRSNFDIILAIMAKKKS